MSKALEQASSALKGLAGAANKFTATATEGSRIIPSKSKDKDIPVRIDAGKYDPNTKKLNVVLQVNSQAKAPGLKDWAKKNTTHAKLATAQFNTAASNKDAEMKRVIDELVQKAKNNVG